MLALEVLRRSLVLELLEELIDSLEAVSTLFVVELELELVFSKNVELEVESLLVELLLLVLLLKEDKLF